MKGKKIKERFTGRHSAIPPTRKHFSFNKLATAKFQVFEKIQMQIKL